MILKKVFLSLMTTATLIGISSCKPTEKGYKAAYDAALGKRETLTETLPVAEGAIGKVQTVEGAHSKLVDGYEVDYVAENLSPEDLPEGQVMHNYNVAVARFKMKTNASSLAGDLRNEDYKAFSAKTGEDNYYVIAASFENITEAAEFYHNLEKNYKRDFVGLGDSPMIVFTR